MKIDANYIVYYIEPDTNEEVFCALTKEKDEADNIQQAAIDLGDETVPIPIVEEYKPNYDQLKKMIDECKHHFVPNGMIAKPCYKFIDSSYQKAFELIVSSAVCQNCGEISVIEQNTSHTKQ